MPNISIIIPVYNVENYLEECLNSVLCQDYKDFEIICINDGSTDTSTDILKKYLTIDDRIKLITQDNQGLSCARNAGIKQAQGKYIYFLDSDDMLKDDKVLSYLYQKAEEYQVDMLVSDFKQWIAGSNDSESDEQEILHEKQMRYSGIMTGQQLFIKMINNNEFSNLCMLLFVKREWLLKNKILFYPGILYEDILFSFKCYMSAKRAVYVGKKFYMYRIRQTSIMNQPLKSINFKSYFICYKQILGEIYNLMPEEELFKAIQKYFYLILHNVQYIGTVLQFEDNEQALFTENLNDLLLLDSLDIDFNKYDINNQIYLGGFNAEIYNNESLLIYGCGVLGKVVYSYLKRQGYLRKIKCFCVTELKKEAAEFCGLPVVCIEDIKETAKDFLLIVAAKRNYQKEMCEKASERGFNKIIVIDYKLEAMMNEVLQEEKCLS